MEVRLVEGDLREAAQKRIRRRTQLRERLDAGEPAADDDDGQQATTEFAVLRETRGLLEVPDQRVACCDGLLDRLHSDRVLSDAGDREGSRDGTGRHDDLVVVVLPLVAARRADR